MVGQHCTVGREASPTCGIRGAKKRNYGIHAVLEVGIRRIPWNTWIGVEYVRNTGRWEVIWNTVYVEYVFRM